MSTLFKGLNTDSQPAEPAPKKRRTRPLPEPVPISTHDDDDPLGPTPRLISSAALKELTASDAANEARASVSAEAESGDMAKENAPQTDAPVPRASDAPDWAVVNRQANVLENVYFPSAVLSLNGLEEKASVVAVRLFLARFREEAGATEDSVEKVLLNQLVVTHLKVGELYALAAAAEKVELKQLYLNAAARLVGLICQLTNSLVGYRDSKERLHRGKNKTERAGTPKAAGNDAAEANVSGEDNLGAEVGSKR